MYSIAWQKLLSASVKEIRKKTDARSTSGSGSTPKINHLIIINNNQYIYKQRQSHAMSQRRWLATAVIFRPLHSLATAAMFGRPPFTSS